MREGPIRTRASRGVSYTDEDARLGEFVVERGGVQSGEVPNTRWDRQRALLCNVPFTAFILE